MLFRGLAGFVFYPADLAVIREVHARMLARLAPVDPATRDKLARMVLGLYADGCREPNALLSKTDAHFHFDQSMPNLTVKDARELKRDLLAGLGLDEAAANWLYLILKWPAFYAAQYRDAGLPDEAFEQARLIAGRRFLDQHPCPLTGAELEALPARTRQAILIGEAILSGRTH